MPDPVQPDSPSNMADLLVKASKPWLLPLAKVAPEANRMAGEQLQSVATLPQRAFEASADRMAGGDVDPGPALETAMLMAGSRAPTIKPGEAGIFGGMLAKGANKPALHKAMDMTLEKKPLNQIWRETGWYRGPDAKWTFEIPDKHAYSSPIDNAVLKDTGAIPLPQYLRHPELYEHYPQLRKWEVTDKTFTHPDGSASAVAWGNSTNPPSIGMPTEYVSAQRKSTGLHEMQHAVEDVEGFAPGSNPPYLRNTYGGPAMKNLKLGPIMEDGEILDHALDAASYNLYQRHVGEVRARNTQYRDKLPAESLAHLPPWLTQDIPSHRQVVPHYWFDIQPDHTQNYVRALLDQFKQPAR